MLVPDGRPGPLHIAPLRLQEVRVPAARCTSSDTPLPGITAAHFDGRRIRYSFCRQFAFERILALPWPVVHNAILNIAIIGRIALLSQDLGTQHRSEEHT